jgi:hypothetical protein
MEVVRKAKKDDSNDADVDITFWNSIRQKLDASIRRE